MAISNIRSLVELYNLADPRELAGAHSSYYRYNEILREIAKRHTASLWTTAGVFAALSPNNSYVQNLKDTEKILAGVNAGLIPEKVSVCTYNLNKLKAWAIAEGVAPLDIIKADKTRNFYGNLADPDNPLPVTVDGHIYWAYHGRRGKVKSNELKMNHALYEEIAECIRFIGEIKGVISNQVQATIWQVYRRIHNIQQTPQLEFLAMDCLAVRMEKHPLATQPIGGR